jgi:RNA polymerase sigma factor (sigma-70 family)
MNTPTYFDLVPGANVLSLQDCVVQYQLSGNENLLRVILYKLKGTINYYLYTKTSYPDKSELTALYEDKLLECLVKYDPQYKAKFITYYSRCLDNALINFVNSSSSQKTYDLSLDFECPEGEYGGTAETYNLVGAPDQRLDDLDTLMFFNAIANNLDENERKVCAVILLNHHSMTYKEIAKEIGLTLAAIPNILKRLRKKFNNLGISNDKFAQPL